MSVGQTYIVTVKSVISGDTLVLLNSKNGELTVNLSGIRAPGISRHPDQTDEPLGFLAREMLRKVTVGKTVLVRIDYSTVRGTTERKYGSVWLKQGDQTPDQDIFKSINNLMLIAGLANPVIPNDIAHGSFSPQEYEVLKNSLEIARRDSKGIHANLQNYENQGKRLIKWARTVFDGQDCIDDLRKRTNTSTNVTVPGIIENVISANTFRVFIPLNNTMITVFLAGTNCPGPTRTVTVDTKPATTTTANTNAAAVAANGRPPTQTVPDPFGTEIHGLADRAFLHRDVTVSFYEIDDKGRVIGSISESSVGDIGLSLLTNGYARVDNRTERMVPVELLGQYRAAERQAKTKRLGVWKDYEDRTPPVDPNAESFKGQILEVHSGDTLTILLNPQRNIYKDPAIERRISLSSVMAPLSQSRDPNRPPNPKAAEAAKEYLRAKYIGKMVQVDVDYTRETANRNLNTKSNANDDANSVSTTAAIRTFATIIYTTNRGDPVDIGEELIGNGLVNIAMHKQGDRRSRRYEALQAAHTQAVAKNAGIHAKAANKNSAAPIPIETIISKADADKRLEYFRREKEMTGIVEAVMNTGRIRLLLPKQYSRINFAIAGVKCPNSGERNNDAEPMGPEGKAYARQLLLNKQVEIIVDAVDQSGKFLGSLWVGEGGQRSNYGVDIVRKGFGYLLPKVVAHIRDSEELFKAEEEASSKKTGLWEFYVEPTEDEEGNPLPGKGTTTTSTTSNIGSSSSSSSSSSSTTGIVIPPLPSSTSSNTHVSSTGMAYVTSPALGGNVWNTPNKTSLVGTTFRCIVSYVQSHTSFYINKDTDSERLDTVNNYLDSLYDQYGVNSAPLGGLPENGKFVACLWHNPSSTDPANSNAMWARARIEGVVKNSKGATSTIDGLTEYNVMYIDIGERSTATVHQMRPLEVGIAAIPPLAIECGLPYLRYPKDFVKDVTEYLKDCALGQFQCTVYDQKDNNKRLLLDLIDTQDNGKTVSITNLLIEYGYVRLSRTETNSVKLKAGVPRNNLRIPHLVRKILDTSTTMDANSKAQLSFVLQLEETQQNALKDHAGMWEFGDVGDTDTEDKVPGSTTGGGRSNTGRR